MISPLSAAATGRPTATAALGESIPKTTADFSRSRRERSSAIFILLTQIVARDKTTLHDKLHALHLRYVHERIAGNGNNVCELALFDGSYLAVPAIVQHVRGRQIRGL